MTGPVSADTVKTNQDSYITKPDALTDNGILTHTDTVNKVGNNAIESESAKVTDSVNFKPDWRSYGHGFHMIKVLGKCVVKRVLKQENNFTTGCTTYKTSSMIRHEATADHKISVAAPKLNNNMTAAINNAKYEQDEAIIKTLKLVNWLACENVVHRTKRIRSTLSGSIFSLVMKNALTSSSHFPPVSLSLSLIPPISKLSLRL